MSRTIPSPRGRPPLIVSTNPDVADLYVLSMRALRTSVLSVNTLAAAVQLLRDGAVSVVVVDVANPATDWELCRLLREAAEPDLPLVVLTGWLDPAARNRAREAGCAAFVSKPVAPDRLMGVLRRVCDGERDIVVTD